jgi:hypothetical protein
MLGETAPAKLYRFFTVSLPKTAFKDGKITRNSRSGASDFVAANCQRAQVISRQQIQWIERFRLRERDYLAEVPAVKGKNKKYVAPSSRNWLMS